MPTCIRQALSGEEAIAAQLSLNPFNGWLSDKTIIFRVTKEYRPRGALAGLGLANILG
jgi:hypothetical protein